MDNNKIFKYGYQPKIKKNKSRQSESIQSNSQNDRNINNSQPPKGGNVAQKE